MDFRFALLVLAIAGAFLFAGCATQAQPPAGSPECVFTGDSCCKGDVCNAVDLLCVEGTSPHYLGCSEECIVIAECS